MNELDYMIKAIERRRSSGEPTNLMDVLLEATQAIKHDKEEERENLAAGRCLTDANYL